MSSELLEDFAFKLIQVCLESRPASQLLAYKEYPPLLAGSGSVSTDSCTNIHTFSTALWTLSTPRHASPYGDAPLYHPQADSSPRLCLHSHFSRSLPDHLAVKGLAGLWCMICPSKGAHTAACAGYQGYGSRSPILHCGRLAQMPVSSSAVPTASPGKPFRRALHHQQQERIVKTVALCSSLVCAVGGNGSAAPALPQPQ